MELRLEFFPKFHPWNLTIFFLWENSTPEAYDFFSIGKKLIPSFKDFFWREIPFQDFYVEKIPSLHSNFLYRKNLNPFFWDLCSMWIISIRKKSHPWILGRFSVQKIPSHQNQSLIFFCETRYHLWCLRIVEKNPIPGFWGLFCRENHIPGTWQFFIWENSTPEAYNFFSIAKTSPLDSRIFFWWENSILGFFLSKKKRIPGFWIYFLLRK